MNKKIITIILFLVCFFIIPFFCQYTFCKYRFDYSFISAKIAIDKKPEIEILSISNTNIGYETYANHTHEITLKVKIKEKNITINRFNSDNIHILINQEIINCPIQIHLISNHNGELIYNIIVSNLRGNGNLSIVFPEGIIQDISGQKNDFQEFDTHIIIDNIAPISTSNESPAENNTSKCTITSKEKLRPVPGWELSTSHTSLLKIFSSPLSYFLPITDYAGNTSDAMVTISNAQNFMLYYANYNGYALSKLYHSGEIAGKQAIIDNSNKKSEMIFTHLEGSITNENLQARIFDYTYWGENTTSICKFSEIDYHYGYSPSPTTWYDIHTPNAVYLLGKLCLQLGGQGHNLANNSCINIYKPIPKEIAKQNLYGISGIAFQLKNCPEYSIVYQIYVPSVGWLKASSDGEETTYAHNQPFSAIRINIVPKSEKQHIMNYWNHAIYSNYVD